MSGTVTKRRSPRGGTAPRRAVVMRAADRPPPQAEALMTDGQRRMLFAMTAAGIGCLLVGLVVPPRDALFWVLLVVGLPAFFIAGLALGGPPGRIIDDWLLGSTRPREAFAPPAPAALPEATRAAFDLALLPALLAELARRAAGMQGRQKAAAEALLAAATAAPDAAEPRRALAAALPRLLGGLEAADAAATAEAERIAALFPRPGAGGRA